MRVVFLWLRGVNTQFENIQGSVVWSRRIGGIQSTVSEVNGTLLKRALFWTGWASIVNTSFSCLTTLPSNRKTEMRPCTKKKKSPKGLQTILDPPCYSPCTARRPCKSKNNFRCFRFLPGYYQTSVDWCLGSVRRGQNNLAQVPRLLTS